MKKTPALKSTPKKSKESFRFPGWLLPLLALLITFAVFIKVSGYDFVSLDDESYVMQNDDIRGLSSDHLKAFFTEYYVGMYQPLTMISYAIDYALFKLNPSGYHAVNLLLHLLNTFLVFLLISRLSRKKFVAFFVAVLFGIHPMHIESVAWISERKDVLYAFFFLASLLSYLEYKIYSGKKSVLFISIICFACSLLSKSMAVTLPAVIFLMDYYFQKPINKKSVIEKIPFLILGAVFCFLAFISQKSQGGINPLGGYNPFDRIFISLYALAYYPVMMIFPAVQSVYHYFPLKSGGFLPLEYYSAALVIPAVYFIIKRIKTNKKELIFGMLFYAITVLPVLQIIPVGDSAVSERYSYMPYIGLFYLIINPLFGMTENNNTASVWNVKTVIAALSLIVLVFSVISFSRAGIWKNSDELLGNLIEKYSGRDHGYVLRGNYLLKTGRFYDALDDYNSALLLNDHNGKTYYHRGKAKFSLNNIEGAEMDFNIAAERGYSGPELYNDRGNARQLLGNNKGALEDFNMALKLKPGFAEAIINRGNTFLFTADYKNAILDYDKAIALKPDNEDVYYNRGVARARLFDFRGSVSDFSEVIRLSPEDHQVYYLRGFSYFNLKDTLRACMDWKKSALAGNVAASRQFEKVCK